MKWAKLEFSGSTNLRDIEARLSDLGIYQYLVQIPHDPPVRPDHNERPRYYQIYFPINKKDFEKIRENYAGVIIRRTLLDGPPEILDSLLRRK